MNWIEQLLKYGPPGVACIFLALSYRLFLSSLKLPDQAERTSFLKEVRVFQGITVIFLIITSFIGFSNVKKINFIIRPKNLSNVESQPNFLLNAIPLSITNGLANMKIEKDASLVADFESVEITIAKLTAQNNALLNESAKREPTKAGDSFKP